MMQQQNYKLIDNMTASIQRQILKKIRKMNLVYFSDFGPVCSLVEKFEWEWKL